MSSDDTSDDSGFDKEAEREKLREKYEQDQQGRENTRRMSELLLQGATMTGKHCNQCGDPVFRYDGQEFCPTCQQAAEGGAVEGGAAESEANQSSQTADGSAADRPDADRSTADQPSASQPSASRPADAPGESDESGASAPDSSDDEPRVEIEGVRVADRHVDRSDIRQPPSKQGGEGRRSAESPRGRARGGRERARDAQESGRGHGPDSKDHERHDHVRGHHARDSDARSRASAAGDLATARASLVRTLTDLARRAEETDDAGRARDLLAATREAAEALAALDRANH